MVREVLGWAVVAACVIGSALAPRASAEDAVLDKVDQTDLTLYRSGETYLRPTITLEGAAFSESKAYQGSPRKASSAITSATGTSTRSPAASKARSRSATPGSCSRGPRRLAQARRVSTPRAPISTTAIPKSSRSRTCISAGARGRSSLARGERRRALRRQAEVPDPHGILHVGRRERRWVTRRVLDRAAQGLLLERDRAAQHGAVQAGSVLPEAERRAVHQHRHRGRELRVHRG